MATSGGQTCTTRCVEEGHVCAVTREGKEGDTCCGEGLWVGLGQGDGGAQCCGCRVLGVALPLHCCGVVMGGEVVAGCGVLLCICPY